jgi:hypothetical protein
LRNVFPTAKFVIDHKDAFGHSRPLGAPDY